MRNGKKQNWFKDNLQVAVTVGTLIIGSLNFFAAYKLAPIAASLDSITNKVNTMETYSKPLEERFYKLEERDTSLVKDVEQMKKDIRDLLIIHRINY